MVDLFKSPVILQGTKPTAPSTRSTPQNTEIPTGNSVTEKAAAAPSSHQQFSNLAFRPKPS
ncbi:hypothetical protein EJ08DRAFT_649603 [Tothia fuscella]|uniref:Uncharacterized protein n=1 Tax=Tothia fuscella TaxID=1048955 RepID=A0A9P4NSN5_9PEZI|nr:hypothetical protein EJ08DRAFT_649603 [Tothia fuscella]